MDYRVCPPVHTKGCMEMSVKWFLFGLPYKVLLYLPFDTGAQGWLKYPRWG